MIPSLRPYQSALVDDIRRAYQHGARCPLVVASTGMGKTVIFSYITHGASLRGNPVLISAHRKEIIRQISLSLAKFGVEHQVIGPPPLVRQIKVAQFRAFGRSFVDPLASTMVGSVQTIVGRLEMIDATVARCRQANPSAKLMVVMDEGHHVVADTQWGRVMDHCDRHSFRGLLVTASPERLDGKGLGRGCGGYADMMIEAPPMAWAIENGFLSPYRVFTTPTPIDMTGAKMRMGDFAKDELDERTSAPQIVGDAISHWRKHAGGMRTVVFCVSIKRSVEAAERFREAGIPAAHIDGGTDDAEREQAVLDFASGKILVLTQVNLISEGFDLSSIAQTDVTIDCLVDLAPTESLVNAMQRWGRVLRPGPGKVAVILDHAANVPRHGMPDTPREWSLDGAPKRKKRTQEEPDVRISTCTKCFAVHEPAPACPVCGHVYPVRPREVQQAEGELVEISAEQQDAMRRAARVMQGRAQSAAELMAQGMSRPRAEKILQARAEKQKMVDTVLDGFSRASDAGRNPWQEFGTSLAALRKMKPKELKVLIGRVEA